MGAVQAASRSDLSLYLMALGFQAGKGEQMAAYLVRTFCSCSGSQALRAMGTSLPEDSAIRLVAKDSSWPRTEKNGSLPFA